MPDAGTTPGFDTRDTSVPMTVALGRLQMGEREAIEIGFFKGWTAEEIAIDLGVSPLVVKRNIRSGLARLKDLLSGLSVTD